MSLERYAVYWAPELDHPLWEAGCAWLGRDPRAALGTPPLRPHVEVPSRYGFHATLKAPMHLVPGCTPQRFLRAVADLAASQPAFEMPDLHVAWLDRFVALRPPDLLAPGHPLQRLADACVTALDGHRGPPSASERARAGVALDPDRQALQARWGYPHVLHHWRFHATLSNRFDDTVAPDAQGVFEAASTAFAAALQVPSTSRSVCVFRQSAPGAVFTLIERLPLAAVKSA